MKSNTNAAPSINVGIVFGNPKIECARFGICDINMIQESTHKCKGVQKAQGKLLNINNKHLSLVFKKKDLHPNVIEKYLSDGYFIIEVDTPLPRNLTDALGMKKHTIVKGNYPIFSASNEVLIILNPEKMIL